MFFRPVKTLNTLRTEAVHNGKTDRYDSEENHNPDEKDRDWRQHQQKQFRPEFHALSDLRAHYGEMTSQHIETRRKLREIPLVEDFEHVLSLCTLDDEDKDILRMHYLNGKDFRFIGDTMGYSERTIKARHKRSLKKISNAL